MLEYLRTWRDVPDNVRKAVVEYLRATWAVYLVSMKKEFGLGDEKVFNTFREKFLAVRKIMKVSHTVKIHIVINHMSEYMENCYASTYKQSYSADLALVENPARYIPPEVSPKPTYQGHLTVYNK